MAGPGFFPIVLAYLKAGALSAFQSAAELLNPGLALFNWVRSKMPGLTSAEASQIYQLGMQSVQAGRAQQNLPTGQALQPDQIPINPELGPTMGPNDIFQYKIGVRTWLPGENRSVWSTTFINSPVTLTDADLWGDIQATLAEDVDRSPKLRAAIGAESYQLAELVIKGISRRE